MALIGLPVGLWLGIDHIITVVQPELKAGNMPTIDFATNLKVMVPIVIGVIGANLFVHKDESPEDND